MKISFAEIHGVIIEQLGRFPYRNKVLGRETTEGELVYLKEGDVSDNKTYPECSPPNLFC